MLRVVKVESGSFVHRINISIEKRFGSRFFMGGQQVYQPEEKASEGKPVVFIG